MEAKQILLEIRLPISYVEVTCEHPIVDNFPWQKDKPGTRR